MIARARERPRRERSHHAPCESPLTRDQLPPRANVNVGVKAADWESNLIWRGRIRILETTTEGSEDEETAGRCEIRLEDAETGELFANAPYAVDGKAIEAVLDSSRYFVLAVVDPASGQRAFLGLVRHAALVIRLTLRRALSSAATLLTSRSRCKSGHGPSAPLQRPLMIADGPRPKLRARRPRRRRSRRTCRASRSTSASRRTSASPSRSAAAALPAPSLDPSPARPAACPAYCRRRPRRGTCERNGD